MDYYCFEDSYIFYRNLINSKLSKIKNSLNEFESLNYNFKSNTLSDNNKLYFCHKTKNHLKQYSISLFNYKTFRNRIREFFDLIHIKNIKDEIKRILKCYKSKINEDRMNFGFSFSISLDSDEIFLHEWCTLICKTNFDESSFSLISNIISNKNLNFIKGDISILCESKKIINITFYEDLTNFQSQFVYRIMSNFQFNHFIFYSSEIKYRSFEDKCFLWKKGNYEKVEQAKQIKHSLVYNNNNVDKRINFSRSVYEKTILSNEITEIKHEWSNDQLEKGDYYKTSVKLSSLNQDYYKITTIITSDSINVLRNEKHSEKKNFSNYEKYGFTNDYFKDKQFSSCSKYIENSDTKIYVKWLKHDNEFKISRFKQDPAQKINEMSGIKTIYLGYKYENNVKVYEFIDRHIEFYEDHSSYTTKNGKFRLLKDFLFLMEISGKAMQKQKIIIIL